MHRSVSAEARKLIAEATGIPPERVMISCTHTHSAASALGQDRYTSEQPLDDYQRFVAHRISDGVRCAVGDLRPAEIAVGRVASRENDTGGWCFDGCWEGMMKGGFIGVVRQQARARGPGWMVALNILVSLTSPAHCAATRTLPRSIARTTEQRSTGSSGKSARPH